MTVEGTHKLRYEATVEMDEGRIRAIATGEFVGAPPELVEQCRRWVRKQVENLHPHEQPIGTVLQQTGDAHGNRPAIYVRTPQGWTDQAGHTLELDSPRSNRRMFRVLYRPTLTDAFYALGFDDVAIADAAERATLQPREPVTEEEAVALSVLSHAARKARGGAPHV